MQRKKRNSIKLYFLFCIVITPFFWGTPYVEAQQKEVVKIQKDEKETPASKLPKKIKEKELTKTGIADRRARKEKNKTTYFYSSVNKVDPFKSFIVVKKELEKDKKPKTYLESLEISQLTLSAIVLSGSGKWALVRDSKGEGHVIKVGTRLGRKGGRVAGILKDKVLVREYYRDIRGREELRDVTMKLSEVD